MTIFGCAITRDHIVDALSIIALAMILPLLGVISFAIILLVVPFIIAGVAIDCMIRKEK